MRYRGLGEYICIKFAEAGANVAINFCKSEDRAKGVLEKVKKFGVKGVIVGGVSSYSDSIHIMFLDLTYITSCYVGIAQYGWRSKPY